jgi:uncharacterized phage protein (TIGR01671 family)
MNREIKFRAWDKLNERMCKVNRYSWAKFVNECIIEHEGKTFACAPIDIELMQFTGLKDKNGKEIYEGDIVQRVGTRDIFQGTADDVFGANPFTITEEVVELKVCADQFGNTTFGYSLNTQRTYSERSNPATYEIIGNIYQHSHLLKTEQ